MDVAFIQESHLESKDVSLFSNRSCCEAAGSLVVMRHTLSLTSWIVIGVMTVKVNTFECIFIYFEQSYYRSQFH